MECANTPINNVLHSDTINHHTLSRPPLHILMRTHHKLNKLWQASMLTDRSMIERAKGKISHETNNSLDERPTGRWVQQFYKDWQAKMNPNCILGFFRILMTAG